MTESSGATETPTSIMSSDVESEANAVSNVDAAAATVNEDVVQFKWQENWRDGLPDDLKNDPTIKTTPDVLSMARSLVSAQRMIGQDKFVVPGKHATEEDYRVAYQKLGLPEKLEEYSLEAPEGVNLEDGFITDYKKAAFEAGVHPKQAQKLISWYDNMNKASVQKLNDENILKAKEVEARLKNDFGQAYAKKINQAKNVLKAHGDDNIFSWLESSGIGNNENFIRLMAALGEKFQGEDSIVGNSADTFARTPGEIDSEINKIMSDPNGPYFNSSHPNHGAAVAEVTKLMKQANPEESR